VARLLYVDDEEPLRRALRAWLVKRGHTVFTAGTVAEARTILTTEAVDGVIIDVWIGRESGVDLFEWIREHQPDVAANVVFVSGGRGSDPDLDRAIAFVGRGVVTKPFDLAELERIVVSWEPT
jgi:DNA-binding response OmpR family regulator